MGRVDRKKGRNDGRQLGSNKGLKEKRRMKELKDSATGGNRHPQGGRQQAQAVRQRFFFLFFLSFGRDEQHNGKKAPFWWVDLQKYG